MILRKKIHVHPSCDRIDPVIKEALACLVPVRFVDCADMAACQRGDAVISLSGDDEALRSMARGGLRCFHVTNGVAGSNPTTGGACIRFGDSSHLDKLLRRRTISHNALSNLSAVRAETGDEVLARYGENPVWVLKRTTDFSADIVSAPLPKLTGCEQTFDYLDGQQFIQLLPLLHFLRQVTVDLAWTRPPLSACLTFDDPNLHWTSYGYFSYQELVKQAKTCGFHVALATVPLDAWGSHRRTVSLFRENPDHLSLLIHGNDHARDELGRTRTSEGHLRLLAQSLRRIVHLEKTTGLNVARVMVPPHEAFAEAALAAMLALGFEGASLTPWMLRNWNPKRQWPSAFGLEIAEMMDGVPVLPRFKLSASCEGPIAVAAFLGRPIIPFGHHDIVADGFELLSRAAETINSFGNVRWCNPETMLRSNHLTLQRTASLCVKPYSCRTFLKIPPDINTLLVVPPQEKGEAVLSEFTMIKQSQGETVTVRIGAGVPVKVVSGDAIELVLSNFGKVDYRHVETLGLSLGALSRRVFCEGRDRLIPSMPKLRRV